MKGTIHLLGFLHRIVSCWFWTLVARTRLLALGAKVGRRLRVTGPLLLRLHPQGVLIIGDDCTLRAGFARNPVGGASRLVLWVGKSATLSIGDNVGISNATLVAMTDLQISDDVRIGGSSCVYDTDFHSLEMAGRLSKPDTGVRLSPVILRRGAFVGGHAILLKGSSLGEGAILGAGSVLTGTVPAGEIWAGNPARRIGTVPSPK